MIWEQKPIGAVSDSLVTESLKSVNPETREVLDEKQEKQRISVIFILLLFAVFFWAGFEQAGSSLSLYTDKYIDRSIGSFEIPTSWFQSVNPLFIVTLAPLFTLFWASPIGRKTNNSCENGCRDDYSWCWILIYDRSGSRKKVLMEM